MGAGFAELFLDGIGGGGQVVPHPGRGLCADFEFEPKTKPPHAPCGAQHGHQASAGREKNEGAVSLTVQVPAGYRLVTLANGSHSIHSLAERETFHPVISPVADAAALYV